ncbi:MAG: urease subunit gamma [Jiangellales bacterium]
MLTPTEVDRLLLHGAATLARARRARGLALNVPEATAIVADTVAEAARDGADHAAALAAGAGALGPPDVLPGVADVLNEVHVEAVFSDGSRLVTVLDPIGGGHLGDEAPGAIVAGSHRDDVVDASGVDAVSVKVINEAPVPISVSSHFHFFEVNPRLRFDRAAGYGRRLAVAAGSTVTFEPGVPQQVTLVPIGGARVVVGFAGLVDGPLDAPGAAEAALVKVRACGFADSKPDADGTSGAERPPATEAVARVVADLAARRDEASA